MHAVQYVSVYSPSKREDVNIHHRKKGLSPPALVDYMYDSSIPTNQQLGILHVRYGNWSTQSGRLTQGAWNGLNLTMPRRAMDGRNGGNNEGLIVLTVCRSCRSFYKIT